MTPHRDHGRGTFPIDRRFPGVGRIKWASGTTDPKMFNALNQMLDTLWRMGRADLLLAIQAHRLHPMIVWSRFRTGNLEMLPDENALTGLTGACAEWVDTLDCTPKYRTSLRGSFNALRIPKEATLADVPQLLKAYRFTALRNGQRRAFNMARTACQGLLRDTMGKRHELYGQVADVQKLTETPRQGNPQSPEDAREIRLELGRHGDTWWSLCCTGMRPKEYWDGRWRVGPNYVQVDGTKTKASKRKVPRLWTPTPPSTETLNGFAQALRKVRTDVKPYDARKTFAGWMEEAGISRSRRRQYMGHQVGDVTEIYERVELARFLEEDADRLKAYLGDEMQLLKVVES